MLPLFSQLLIKGGNKKLKMSPELRGQVYGVQSTEYSGRTKLDFVSLEPDLGRSSEVELY